jgi:hypothetical protein
VTGEKQIARGELRVSHQQQEPAIFVFKDLKIDTPAR